MSDHEDSVSYNRCIVGIIFGIIAIMMLPETVWAETVSVNMGDMSLDIEYTAINMTVNNAMLDPASNSLIFDVSTLGEGMITITLERSFLDAVLDGEDQEYHVTVDDIPSTVTEETTSDQRVLSVLVPTGSQTIEIIGTVLGKDTATPSAPTEPLEPIQEIPTNPVVTEPPAPTAPVVPSEPLEPIQDIPVDPIIAAPIDQTTPPDPPASTQPIQDIPIDPVVTEPPEPPSPPVPIDASSDICGPGTMLDGDTCVLVDSAPVECIPDPVSGVLDDNCVMADEPTQTSMERMSGITSTVFAFVVAGGVAMILALIARASKRR